MSDLTTIEHLKYSIAPTGLTIHADLTPQEYEECWHRIWLIRTAIAWSIGDLLVYAENIRGEHGQTYAQAMSITHYSEQTLKNYAAVSRAFPEKYRARYELSHSHFAAAASLDTLEERFEVLELAVIHEWGRDEVRDEVQRRKPKPVEPEPDEPDTAPVSEAVETPAGNTTNLIAPTSPQSQLATIPDEHGDPEPEKPEVISETLTVDSTGMLHYYLGSQYRRKRVKVTITILED